MSYRNFRNTCATWKHYVQQNTSKCKTLYLVRNKLSLTLNLCVARVQSLCCCYSTDNHLMPNVVLNERMISEFLNRTMSLETSNNQAYFLVLDLVTRRMLANSYNYTRQIAFDEVMQYYSPPCWIFSRFSVDRKTSQHILQIRNNIKK